MTKPVVRKLRCAVSRTTERYEALVEELTTISISGTTAFGNSHDEHECLTLYFSDEALAVREELEARHLALMDIEGMSRKLASHVGKYDGIFARLCVVWHRILNTRRGAIPPEVSAETASRVAAFLHEFVLPHAAAFYTSVIGPSSELEELQGIASYVLTAGLEIITMRDCQRGVHAMRSLDRWQFQRLMERFESVGWVAQVDPPKNSSAPRWAINPRVHKLFQQRAAAEAARKGKIKAAWQALSANEEP